MSSLFAVLFPALFSVGIAAAQHQHDHQHEHPPAAKPEPQPPQPHDHSQHENPAQAADPHAGHRDMDHSTLNRAGSFLMGQSSGTALQPASWPMPMLMTKAGQWNFMWMGQAYLVGTQQSGPRGGDKIYSANWGMLSAVRSVGRGAVMIRSMLTLEPATVTNRSYPLLFQTGESAYGRPLVDAQHPHELLMELSVQYARPVGENGMFNVYYAPVGDAALGPVAFPHRASAMELPQATLGHHWQDSTHIANNLVTAGMSWRGVRLEASGFRGKEPNENRWNIDMGAMDSWSSRLSLFPTRNWMFQVSGGHLTRPEQFHPDDVDRVTASAHYIVPKPNGNYWATSLIWARNYKTVAQRATNAVIGETVVPIRRNNFITARYEWSQRDELFEYDHELAHEIEHRTGKTAFDVSGVTVGYTRDVSLFKNVQTGIGANVTSYMIASELKPFYGSRPWGVNVFLRIRLRGGE